MTSRLAQQRMTLSDLEWPFNASGNISQVAELLVYSEVSPLCVVTIGTNVLCTCTFCYYLGPGYVAESA